MLQVDLPATASDMADGAWDGPLTPAELEGRVSQSVAAGRARLQCDYYEPMARLVASTAADWAAAASSRRRQQELHLDETDEEETGGARRRRRRRLKTGEEQEEEQGLELELTGEGEAAARSSMMVSRLVRLANLMLAGTLHQVGRG